MVGAVLITYELKMYHFSLLAAYKTHKSPDRILINQVSSSVSFVHTHKSQPQKGIQMSFDPTRRHLGQLTADSAPAVVCSSKGLCF